jgi:hypothetical protein
MLKKFAFSLVFVAIFPLTGRSDQASAQAACTGAVAAMVEAIDYLELAESGQASVDAYRLDVVGWRATAQLTQYQVWDYNNSMGAAESNIVAIATNIELGKERQESGDEWLDAALDAYDLGDWTTAEGCAGVAEYDYEQATIKFQQALEAGGAAWEFLEMCEGIVNPPG